MKFILLLCTCLVFFNGSIPFKPNDEFDLKLEFQFKPRHIQEHQNVMDLGYERLNQSTGPLPYLYAHLTVLKVRDDEVKIKIVNNLGNVVASKKLKKDQTIDLDLGFTDDLKGHVTPFMYTVNFLSADKEIKRIIVIHFEKDGTYRVNDEVRGKL